MYITLSQPCTADLFLRIIIIMSSAFDLLTAGSIPDVARVNFLASLQQQGYKSPPAENVSNFARVRKEMNCFDLECCVE